MTQTDSLSIVHVKHIDKHRAFHRSNCFGVEAESLGVIDEVLFIGSLLAGQAILPKVAQGVRTVIALNYLTAGVYGRRAGIGRRPAGYFLRPDILCHRLCSCFGHSLGSVLGLRFVDKKHGVALSLYM